MPENRNPRARGLDALETVQILDLISLEDAAALKAVGEALPRIEQAVEDAVKVIRSGGRIFYAGAGTSGRLGVLDASEIPPTFGSTAFRAVMAGGSEAITVSVEGAEDDARAGEKEAGALNPGDMAVGITASGSTPFVMGFLRQARKIGAKCWLICSDAPGAEQLDGVIQLKTGAELLAGSTRMKAGSAQKMCLTMFSTATMIRLGGSYDGLMVDVVPTNSKLVTRAENIVMEITGATRKEAVSALNAAGMRPKVAALMLMKELTKEEAESELESTGGSLREALANS